MHEQQACCWHAWVADRDTVHDSLDQEPSQVMRIWLDPGPRLGTPRAKELPPLPFKQQSFCWR